MEVGINHNKQHVLNIPCEFYNLLDTPKVKCDICEHITLKPKRPSQKKTKLRGFLRSLLRFCTEL